MGQAPCYISPLLASRMCTGNITSLLPQQSTLCSADTGCNLLFVTQPRRWPIFPAGSCWRHCLRSSSSLNHYFTHELEQGGYISVVEFYPTREDLDAASGWKSLSSPIRKDGATSMKRSNPSNQVHGKSAAQGACRYNYEQLKQVQRNNASLRLGSPEKERD